MIFLMAQTLINLHRTDRKKAKFITILILNLAVSDLLVSVRRLLRIVGSFIKLMSSRLTFSLSVPKACQWKANTVSLIVNGEAAWDAPTLVFFLLLDQRNPFSP